MQKVSIKNIDFKVCTHKNDLPQSNYIHSLTQTAITRQIPFKLMDIEYARIKDEIEDMERIQYNTAIGINIINEYDIEDFVNA